MSEVRPETVVLPGRVLVPGVGQLRLAEFGLRAAARIIDTFATVSIVLAFYVVGGRLALRSVDTSDGALGPAGTRTLVFALALAVVLTVLYDVGATAVRGATLGKRIVGIRVISAADGGRPGWWRAVRRFVLPAVSNIVFGLGVVVLLTPMLDHHRRQGWHDMLAGTLVVSRR